MIQSRGQKVFYEGKLADKIVEDFSQNGGLISSEDLFNYKVYLKDPILRDLQRIRCLLNALPSSGGIAIIQMLNIIENFDLKNYLIFSRIHRAVNENNEFCLRRQIKISWRSRIF